MPHTNAQEPARLLDVRALQEALTRFARARDWEQYHSPKNLSMALTGEVGELVELFQWCSEADSYTIAEQSETAEAVRDEIADVFIYLVRLADVLAVDLDAAVRAKLARNALRYPPLTRPIDSP